VLGVTERADLETWMTNNKTEAALRITEASDSITPPSYFTEAIEFISDGCK
jgi:putative ATP-dependent endonuclease of the OLD family